MVARLKARKIKHSRKNTEMVHHPTIVGIGYLARSPGKSPAGAFSAGGQDGPLRGRLTRRCMK